MVEFSIILEMVRNLGLAVAAFVGIFLAWKRVTVANRQADATLQQSTRFGRSPATFPILPDLAEPTSELISTHLRESAGNYEGSAPPIEVREIMKTLIDYLVVK